MKMKNLLVAALLLGGMTAFNACSEKDEIDDVTPPVVQPAEGVETILSLGAGLGDNIQTRAEGDYDESKGNNGDSNDKIRNYIWAIFGIGEDESIDNAEFLGIQYQYSQNNMEGSEFTLQPIKFKMTEGQKLAVVVLANCDQLFQTENGKRIEELNSVAFKDGLTTYKAFQEVCNKYTMGYIYSNKFNGYPMSSNVIVLNDVQVGKFNASGFGANATTQVQQLYNKYYGAGTVTNEEQMNLKVADYLSIPLYRMWSQIELTGIAVKKYDNKDAGAKFDLKEVFLMNVPNISKAIDNTNAVTSVSNWYKWGSPLTYAGVDALANATLLPEYENADTRGGFVTGYKRGWSDLKIATTEAISKQTKYLEYLDRDLTSKKVTDHIVGTYNKYQDNMISLDNENPVTDLADFKVNSTFAADQFGANKAPVFNFIVPESNYGKAMLEEDSKAIGQAILLVVKGDYTQVVSPGVERKYEDVYYTIVVNDAKTSSVSEASSPAHSNEIIRNVKYEIDLTVSGPGSPTPDPLESTYLIPKLTVVKFGLVKQNSERD